MGGHRKDFITTHTTGLEKLKFCGGYLATTSVADTGGDYWSACSIINANHFGYNETPLITK